MSLIERRRVPRILSHSQATVLLRGRWHRASLIDISLGGALVSMASDVQVAAGKPCGLSILHADQTANFHGLVVHCEEGCLGVKFIGVGHAQLTALCRILELNSLPEQFLDRDVPALLKGRPRIID